MEATFADPAVAGSIAVSAAAPTVGDIVATADVAAKNIAVAAAVVENIVVTPAGNLCHHLYRDVHCISDLCRYCAPHVPCVTLADRFKT